jgi:hypothetical protein
MAKKKATKKKAAKKPLKKKAMKPRRKKPMSRGVARSVVEPPPPTGTIDNNN